MAGLKVWDGAGNVVLDISDRLSRALGSFSVGSNAAPSSGSFSVPGLTTGTFWYIDGAQTVVLGESVRCSVSGSTLSWSATVLSVPHTIHYGVY